MSFLVESSYGGSFYLNKDSRQNSRVKQINKMKENNFQKDEERNPYTYLIEKLSSRKSTEIFPRDLAYLRDLGVYPTNRMFILRRFDSSGIVGPEADLRSDNIYKDSKPVSVVIGWIDDESLFDLSVSEVWTTEKRYLHEIIGDILKNEFGLNATGMASVPGWSQGLLISLLNNLGFTDANVADLFGNPNVLQEGATREGGGKDSSFTLKSDWSFTLKTAYEAKYIYDIDPVDAMKSIVDNLLAMGSSTEVLFNIDQEGANLFKTLTGTPEAAWGEFKGIISKFLNTIKDLAGKQEPKEPEQKNQTPTANSKNEKQETATSDGGTSNPQVALADKLLNVIGNAASDVWYATIGKYRWPLRGVYGVHTGKNTTPWHLTIGNPLSPVLSMNHIVVDNVSIKSPVEFTFNDVPKYIEATIRIKNSRNMGTNELSPMFFRNHLRTYASPEILHSTIVTNKIFAISDPNQITEKEGEDVRKTGRDSVAPELWDTPKKD